MQAKFIKLDRYHKIGVCLIILLVYCCMTAQYLILCFFCIALPLVFVLSSLIFLHHFTYEKYADLLEFALFISDGFRRQKNSSEPTWALIHVC